MAAKFLELFFLIIGTAGISTVYSLQEFFNTNKKPFSNWANLENVHIFGPRVPSVPNSFHNRKTMIYHPEIFRPRARDDDLRRFDSLSLFRDSDAARWRNNNLNFDDYLSRFRDSDAARWRNNNLNFDDYLSRFRDSDAARWRDDDFSDINNDNVGLTDSKNTFTTFESSSERVTTKSSTINEDRKNTLEFLTNISTKNEGIDDSFIGKYEDRIDGLTFSNSDSTTSDPTIPGTKSETRCTLCDFISFMKSKKEVLRTESRPILDISSTTKKEATDVSDETNFSNDTEITKQQNSTIVPNVESTSTVFHPLSLIKVTSLNDQVRYSDGIEHTSKKELKLEPTVTESSLLNSQEIHSISTTKNIQTNSDISFSSFAATFDDTISQSKLSFPFETRSTIENVENKPTAESFLSSVKVTVSSFMDKETKGRGKEIFSEVSPSLEIHFAREVIKEDHIIEISSIRTARIVVTTVFLVIALTALTLLAVYLFRLRRREVQYDTLMLIS